MDSAASHTIYCYTQWRRSLRSITPCIYHILPLHVVCVETIDYIVSIWKKVKEEHHTYRCVQSLAFLAPKIQQFNDYNRLINLSKSNAQIKVADVGCCFGQDIRRLILDGIPPASIYAIDVTGGYWDAGLEIYRDTSSLSLARHSINEVHTLFCDLTSPDVSDTVTTELLNQSFDCLILKNVFHVLSLAQSETLVRRMNCMLKPGGFIMGICLGAQQEKDWARTPDGSYAYAVIYIVPILIIYAGSDVRYLHSKKTLTSMFTRLGFRVISIEARQIGRVRKCLIKFQ
jgi:SAM-dependent methyltransferase